MYSEDSKVIYPGDRVVLWEKAFDTDTKYATVTQNEGRGVVWCLKDSGGRINVGRIHVRKISYMEEPSIALLKKYISKLLEII